MGRIGYFINADNAGASEDELLKRDQLAHELMYFSRGNPVVYYGDEQGFTGTGGDQLARQTMFASQVPEYLDDDLLGTTRTHAQDNFETSHPLYTDIAGLAELAKEHPALRNGAQQHRYASDGPGIYAFSGSTAVSSGSTWWRSTIVSSRRRRRFPRISATGTSPGSTGPVRPT